MSRPCEAGLVKACGSTPTVKCDCCSLDLCPKHAHPSLEPPACAICGGNGWVDDYRRGAGATCIPCNGTGNGLDEAEQSELDASEEDAWDARDEPT